jgi:hypothetical protein
MRLHRTICIAAAFAFASLICAAQAQPQSRLERVQAGQETAAPVVRFRARSAAERTATVRRVLGPQATLNMTAMNAPFSLSPRRPHIAGRGWLEGINVLATLPHAGDEGVIQFQHGPTGWSRAIIRLVGAQGKRFLVDCTVHGRLRASTSSISAEVAAPASTSSGLSMAAR